MYLKKKDQTMRNIHEQRDTTPKCSPGALENPVSIFQSLSPNSSA